MICILILAFCFVFSNCIRKCATLTGISYIVSLISRDDDILHPSLTAMQVFGRTIQHKLVKKSSLSCKKLNLVITAEMPRRRKWEIRNTGNTKHSGKLYNNSSQLIREKVIKGECIPQFVLVNQSDCNILSRQDPTRDFFTTDRPAL